MYIIKNALVSIWRNKGRNILIGIIIVVIACASTITLAIRNTANNIVDEYLNANDIVGTISFERKSLMENFKGGEDATKENIEAFNDIESFTLEDINNYGDSKYLKGYYYVNATSLDSDTLTKASDTYEYEVTDKKTTSSSKKSSFGTPPKGFPRGNFGTNIENNKTITITKRTEKFNSARMLTGAFEVDGYSSYDAMTDFTKGNYKVTEGEMIKNFDEFECVINSELAKLNEVSVGDTIKLKNTNKKKTYEFKVVGIYEDNKDSEDTNSMYSKSVNTIITGAGVVDKLVSDDEDLVTNLTPSFIIKDEESIELFSEELKTKELNEYYSLTTNLEELESATKSISNVGSFATTFLIITLIISAVVLLIINMINIRERKYEIGVFRTIGLSKIKLALQFVVELFVVAIASLMIGATVGAVSSKNVGNYLLSSEISNMESSEKEKQNNFGMPDMNFEFNKGVQIKQIDSIDAVVDYVVVLELLGIGLGLIFVSSIASMISIERFSPLTILKERS